MGVFSYAKTIVQFLGTRKEASVEELKKLVPERRLYDILAILEATGLIERLKTEVKWLGGSIGKTIVIEGLINSVTASPTGVKVTGMEPLRVKVREI